MSTKVPFHSIFKLLENMSTKVLSILFLFKLLENMSTKVLFILFSREIIPPNPPSFRIFNPDKLIIYAMKEYSTECKIKTQGS